jgi:hypothetical protein
VELAGFAELIVYEPLRGFPAYIKKDDPTSQRHIKPLTQPGSNFLIVISVR